MTAPQPRIDQDGPDQGVPFCSAECPHFLHPVGHSAWCKILGNATDEFRPCLPAVRIQSQRLAEVEATLKNARETADLMLLELNAGGMASLACMIRNLPGELAEPA